MLNLKIGKKHLFSHIIDISSRRALRCCGRAIPAHLLSKIDNIREIITSHILQSPKMGSKRFFLHIIDKSFNRAADMLWIIPAHLPSKLSKIWKKILSHIMQSPKMGSKRFFHHIVNNPARELLRCCGRAIPPHLSSKMSKIWKTIT